MMGPKLYACLAIGLVAMLALACGGASGSDELQEALKSVAQDDLAMMVLPQEQLGEAFASLRMDEDSGFTLADDRAEDTIDPDDTGDDLRQAGWIAGYHLSYIDPELSALDVGEGVISVGTEVDLFKDSGAASAFFTKQGTDFQRLEGEAIGDALSLEEVKTFSVDDLAEEALGLRVQSAFQDLQFYQTVVAFRLDRLVAAAVLFRADDADVHSQVEEIAHALEQSIEDVLLGGLSASGRLEIESDEFEGDDFEGDESAGTIQPQFVGSWRIYSESIYFDAGGGGGTDTSASLTRKLDLHEDGAWQFGSSSGTWFTAFVDPADWDRWGVDPYGPESKIVLEGWNGEMGDGPIEESEGNVDFFWVIYRVDEPDPGTVFIKFGHP